MKIKIRIYLLILALSLALLVKGALHAAPGKTGVSFLSMGNGAQGVGMGEAQAALAEGANAIYWNPAGLGLTFSNEVLVSHLQHFEDTAHQYAAIALPISKGRKGGFGFSVTRFAIGKIESRDATSALLSDVEQEDLSLQLSYGGKLLGQKSQLNREGLFGGVSLKRVTEDLAGVKASGIAADIGAQYRPGGNMADKFGPWIRRTSFGLASVNMGQGLKFDQETTDLPQEMKLGMGYTHFILGDALNLALDARFPKENDSFVSVGGEFWLKNMLALRLGYVGGQDVGENVRAGAGFRFRTFQIDYAWAGFGEALGDTHRFSFQMRFGESADPLITGQKSDLIEFYLSEAQDALAAGAYHEAVINAHNVLELDKKNSGALQIMFEAGQKIKTIDPSGVEMKEGGTNER